MDNFAIFDNQSTTTKIVSNPSEEGSLVTKYKATEPQEVSEGHMEHGGCLCEEERKEPSFQNSTTSRYCLPTMSLIRLGHPLSRPPAVMCPAPDSPYVSAGAKQKFP